METVVERKPSIKERVSEHLNKSKQGDKKAWLINAIIIAVIVIAWVVIHNIQVNRYGKEVRATAELIRTASIDSEYMIDDYSSEWDSAIEMGMDFDRAIDHQHEEFQAYGEIDEVEKSQKEIKEKMANLNDPPGKYEEAHTYLIELYGSYKTYSNLSIYPSGSLTTFNQKTGELKSEIEEGVDKIDTLVEE